MSEQSVLKRLQGLLPGRVPPLALCYATERDHFKILKHTACNECVMSVDCRL